MVTLPTQRVNTATAAVSSLAIVPGPLLPDTPLGTANACACEVVMVSPRGLMIVSDTSGGAIYLFKSHAEMVGSFVRAAAGTSLASSVAIAMIEEMTPSAPTSGG